MQDDKPEPAELKEVIEVVTTAKLMTKVVTAAATTFTAAPITAATITAALSAGREKISLDKIHFRSDAQQSLELMLLKTSRNIL
nr:hypothetical protein [Tanacetum cinerariifolium]